VRADAPPGEEHQHGGEHESPGIKQKERQTKREKRHKNDEKWTKNAGRSCDTHPTENQNMGKHSVIEYKIPRITCAKLDKMFKFNRKFIKFS
jgi:hypothetical protein